MTPLQQRMLEDMQLRGLAPVTQQAYVRYVQQLEAFTGKPPDQTTDEDFRQFFLALHKVRGLSRSSATVAIAAFKFLFEMTLQRPWPRLDLFRPRPTQTLPVVLSVEEVWRILDHIDRPTYYACLATIYTCGLRISEGVNLQVSWIDSARRQLQIRGGKGLKDRYIPLPPLTLTLLRRQWRTHRNPVWLFPAGPRAGMQHHTAPAPIHVGGVREAFRDVLTLELFRRYGPAYRALWLDTLREPTPGHAGHCPVSHRAPRWPHLRLSRVPDYALQLPFLSQPSLSNLPAGSI